MTSVQNLRPRLNGNRLLAVLLLCLMGMSCGILNPDKGGKTSTADPIENENENKVRVFNPESGQYENVPVSDIRIDTVDLIDITARSKPPIKETEFKIEGEKKSAYHFSLLMPFNAIRYQNISSPTDARGRRFIQYYAGARIAVDELMNEGIRINMHVYDTEESDSKLQSILKDPNLKSSDLIIGPYRRNLIEEVSRFSSKNKMTTVSPWIPGFDLTADNSKLVHMTPGLEAHADAIFQHIAEHHPNAQVFVISRNNERELKRLEMFREACLVTSLNSDSLETLLIDDQSSDLQNTDWLTLFENPAKAIFVVPYYSRNDEGFVNSVLRKIHAERLEKEVVVYGLPQWLSFRNLNYDYLESLQVHLSTISFTDKEHPKYQFFASRFYDRYGVVPEDPAYRAYDLVYFLGKAMYENGTDFLPSIIGENVSGMNLGFDIEPVFRSEVPDDRASENPKYLENRGIRILKFEGLQFHIQDNFLNQD